MLKPRRRLYILLVLVIASALVLEPLAARPHEPGPRGPSVDLSSPFRAIGSALAAIPDAVGAAASNVAAFFGGFVSSSDAEAAKPEPSPSPGPSTPAERVEVTSMRSRDAKFFRNRDGSHEVWLGRNQHYEKSPGVWEDVDLNFRADGSDHVMDRADYTVRVTSDGVRTADRKTGRGVFWPTPRRPQVSGHKASFTGPLGLTWTYANTGVGVKLSAMVTRSLGAFTFSVPYQLVGGAKPLTVDDEGNLVSDAFVVPRAFAYGADLEIYPVSAWRIESDGKVSFDFDDSTLPARAFPYELDPTTGYMPFTSSDDGHTRRDGAVTSGWPPTGNTAAYTTNTEIAASKSKIGSTYTVRNGLMKFTTELIPDEATVIAAYLHLTFKGKADQDQNRGLTAEWYPISNWPINTADYTPTSSQTAGGPWDLADLSGKKDLSLVSISNISKTANTGVRMHLNGNAPAGDNSINWSAWDGGPTDRPLLKVTYNRAPTATILDSPINAATVPSVTPVLKASATDPDTGDVFDYLFEVAENSTFTQNRHDSGWLSRTNTFTVPPGWLKDGNASPYYWRATARDQFGFTAPVSGSRTFNVRTTKLGARDYWPMWSHGPVTVNQATGNMVLGVPGPIYATASGSMSASASYNLHNTTNGDGLGAGWVLNAGEGLASPPSRLIDHSLLTGEGNFDAVEMLFPDGGSDYYTHVGGTNTYQSPLGDGATLKKNADSTWTLNDVDGAIYSFGTAATGTGIANLSTAEIADASPGQGKLTYTFSGAPLKIASIADTSGRAINFVRPPDPSCPTPALLCMSGPDSVVWKYIADESGRLSIVNNGTRDLLKITYDGSGRPQKIQNANDLNSGDASPGYNGTHAITIGYDTATPVRVSAVTDGPVTGQTPTNSSWTLAYFPHPEGLDTGEADGPSAPAKSHEGIAAGGSRRADGYTEVTPPNQQGQPSPKATRIYYDNLGRTMEARDILTPPNKTLVGYNEKDQLLWSEDEQGNPTDNTYDPVNDVLLTATGPDPDGVGALGRPVTTYRYDETAIGTSSTPGPALQGLQASYYDNKDLAGRPDVRKTTPNIDFNWVTGGPAELPGITDNFSVRWTGNLNVATAGDYTFTASSDDGVRFTIDTGSATVAAIDDWVTQAYERVSAPITLSAGLHKITLDYYEATGGASIQLRWACASCGISDQVVPASALRPAWLNQTSVIDPSGRLSFHHFAEPEEGHPDYDLVKVGTQNLITSYTYDSTGRITQKVMPKGNASRTIDSSGTLLGSPDVTYATDWTYYGASETAAPPAACGGGAAVLQGGLLKTVTPRGIATTTNVYDLAGRVIATTNGAGTTCNTYSAEGLLTADKAPGESASTTYTYDPAGAQRTATDTSGIVTTEYDEQGRVKRAKDSWGAESTFVYDANGNQIQRTAAVGPLASSPNYTTSYSYNAADRLISLTDPASTPENPRIYSFTYDSRGNLHTIQMPNSTFVWQDFNAAGWLTGLYNRHGTLSDPLPGTVPTDSNPLSDYTYTYGIDGRKAQETRLGGGFTTQTTDYTYDAAGRLATANLPDTNNNHTLRTYSYDQDSNRIEVKDGSTVIATGVYDPTDPDSDGVDQLTRYTAGGSTKDYVHSPDGEVISRGSDSFTWDGRGRMTGGSFAGGVLSYGFDATGRLRSRTSGGTTTHFRYAGGDAHFDTSSAGDIQRTGIDGPAGDLAHYLGAPLGTTATEFLYYTGHGDLAATANEAGVRGATFTYDPFGVPVQTPPANSSIERWTGKWDKRLDTTSSLIQMGARPYDPALGRFLAVDPIEGGSLNNYEYAGQDPINKYDLDGQRMADDDRHVKVCDNRCRSRAWKIRKKFAKEWAKKYKRRKNWGWFFIGIIESLESIGLAGLAVFGLAICKPTFGGGCLVAAGAGAASYFQARSAIRSFLCWWRGIGKRCHGH